jgi:hypothetical protein
MRGWQAVSGLGSEDSKELTRWSSRTLPAWRHIQGEAGIGSRRRAQLQSDRSRTELHVRLSQGRRRVLNRSASPDWGSRWRMGSPSLHITKETGRGPPGTHRYYHRRCRSHILARCPCNAAHERQGHHRCRTRSAGAIRPRLRAYITLSGTAAPDYRANSPRGCRIWADSFRI